MMVTWRRERGDAAERRAETHLLKAGLVTLARNFHCRWGEIDLVMRDGRTLVFVEVRRRQSARFGGASGSITTGKQRRLLRAASEYLARHASNDSLARFDVVAVTDETDTLEWLQDAFGNNA